MSVPPGLLDTPGFQIPDFANLQGPYLVGTFLSCVLAGVVLVQAGEYFNLPSLSDGRIFRLYTAFLTAVVLANAVCNCYRTSSAEELRAGADLVFRFVTIVVAPSVQTFFAFRSWAVIRSSRFAYPLVLLMSVMICATFISATGAAIVQVRFDFLKLEIWAQLQLWMSAVADLLISSIFIGKLLILGHDQDFLKTAPIITKLWGMSLRTAALTSIVAVTAAIINNIDSLGLWSVALQLALPYVYMISAFYVLIARHAMREGTMSGGNSAAVVVKVRGPGFASSSGSQSGTGSSSGSRSDYHSGIQGISVQLGKGNGTKPPPFDSFRPPTDEDIELAEPSSRFSP